MDLYERHASEKRSPGNLFIHNTDQFLFLLFQTARKSGLSKYKIGFGRRNATCEAAGKVPFKGSVKFGH